MHVRSFTEPPDNLLAYIPWQLQHPLRKVDSTASMDAGWQTVDVEARFHSNGFVARIDGVSNRAAAVALRGARIGVPASLLPPAEEDEYYWRDLIGLRVVSRDGENLGRVASLMPTPAHDVLVLEDAAARDAPSPAGGEQPRSAGRERLIPFVRQVVAAVDADAGCIVVDWAADWQ